MRVSETHRVETSATRLKRIVENQLDQWQTANTMKGVETIENSQ